MRPPILCPTVLCMALLALVAVAPARAGTAVSAFYYPWFGDGAAADGGFDHWPAGGHIPPDDIASNYYPADGVYSSASSTVLNTQMDEVKRAGIDELAVSWWGRGSPEDARLPAVIAAAGARGISVAVHLEPY